MSRFKLSLLGLALVGLVGCGADALPTGSSISSPTSTNTTASLPSNPVQPSFESSALFFGDPDQVTLNDVALVLACFNLSDNCLNSETLIATANTLLGLATGSPGALQVSQLDPPIESIDVFKFVASADGSLSIFDAAFVLAAVQSSNFTLEQLVAVANSLLGATGSNAIVASDILRLPGTQPTPTPEPTPEPSPTPTGGPGEVGGPALVVVDDAGVASTALDVINSLPSSLPRGEQLLLPSARIVFPAGADAAEALRLTGNPPLILEGTGIRTLLVTGSNLGCGSSAPATCGTSSAVELIPAGTQISVNDYELTYTFTDAEGNITRIVRFLSITPN